MCALCSQGEERRGVMMGGSARVYRGAARHGAERALSQEAVVNAPTDTVVKS